MIYWQTIDKNCMFLTENAKISARSLRSLVNIHYEQKDKTKQNKDYNGDIIHENVLLRYAPDCIFSSWKLKKLPTVGGHTLPVSVAPLPRKLFAPQMFWLITPLMLTAPCKLYCGPGLLLNSTRKYVYVVFILVHC